MLGGSLFNTINTILDALNLIDFLNTIILYSNNNRFSLVGEDTGLQMKPINAFNTDNVHEL